MKRPRLLILLTAGFWSNGLTSFALYLIWAWHHG